MRWIEIFSRDGSIRTDSLWKAERNGFRYPSLIVAVTRLGADGCFFTVLAHRDLADGDFVTRCVGRSRNRVKRGRKLFYECQEKGAGRCTQGILISIGIMPKFCITVSDHVGEVNKTHPANFKKLSKLASPDTADRRTSSGQRPSACPPFSYHSSCTLYPSDQC